MQKDIKVIFTPVETDCFKDCSYGNWGKGTVLYTTGKEPVGYANCLKNPVQVIDENGYGGYVEMEWLTLPLGTRVKCVEGLQEKRPKANYTHIFTHSELVVIECNRSMQSPIGLAIVGKPERTGSAKLEDLIVLPNKEEGDFEMYEIKELKTRTEIYAEGRAQGNALSNKHYVKNLTDQGVKIYVCRKLDNPNEAFVTFAIFPKGYKGQDTHMFEKWGDQYINIRARDNQLPSEEVMTYVKAWCQGKGLIEVPPKKVGPEYTLFNGKEKIMDVYDEDELAQFIIDIAGQLLRTDETISADLFKKLGYTLKK